MSTSSDDVPLAQVAKKQTEKNVEKMEEEVSIVKKEEESTIVKKEEGKERKADTTSGVSSGGTAKKNDHRNGDGKNKDAEKEMKNGEEVKKKMKVMYDKPGQTRAEPPEEDPLRRFYTSLLEQKPTSEMAKRWCVMCGLLPVEEAKKWVEENQKKKGLKSPQKKRAVSKDGARSAVEKKKRKLGDEKVGNGKGGKKVKRETSGGVSESSVVKQRRAQTTPKSRKKPRTPQSKQKKKDVAFLDGGLDGSDSEDDIPLIQRVKA